MPDKPKPYHPSDHYADGDYEAQHKDQKFEKKVRTTIAADGVEETQIAYVPRKRKAYSIPR